MSHYCDVRDNKTDKNDITTTALVHMEQWLCYGVFASYFHQLPIDVLGKYSCVNKAGQGGRDLRARKTNGAKFT